MKNETVSSLTLEVSLSNTYGPSTASVLIMALTEHRDYSLRAVMIELKNKDLGEAFHSYSDYQDCVKMLDNLLRESASLGYHNHLLANPSQRESAEQIRQRKDSDFKLFLEEFSLTDPDAE